MSAVVGEPPDDANLLSQTIELAGQPRYRKAAALGELGVALGELIERRLAVAWQTASAYGGLVAARENLALAREERAAQDSLLHMTRRRYETGQIPQMQVVRMEREHGRATRALLRSELEESAARQVLELLVKRPVPESQPVAGPALPVPPADVASLVEQALRGRPDVLILHSELKARLADLSLARTQHAPFLEIQVRQSRLDNPASQVGANVSLNWPIADWGQLRAQAALAGTRVEEVSARLATRTRDAEAQVREAHGRWNRVSRERRLLESGELLRAVRLMSMVERGYAAGLVTQLEVLEARTSLREVRSELARLRAQEASAAWDLLRAMGSSRPEAYELRALPGSVFQQGEMR